MPTPQGIRTVTLRGRYVEPDLLGTAHSGIVTFSPNVPMVIFPVENTLMAGTETATLDANGEFIIDLPCTDTPGQNPTNWTYTVTEKIVGVKPRTFNVVLNFTMEVVELSDIIPTAQAPDYLPVYGPQGPPGVVQSVNGYSQVNVVLTAADVDAVPDSGASTITGTKTFTSSPIVPTPLGDNEVATKAYVDIVDGTGVKLTGNQSVAGVKTFTSIPLLPASDPTTTNQVTRKGYVDTGLALKADGAATATALTLKANQAEVDSALALKADLSATTDSLNLKADDDEVVKLTGTQAIAGSKTFSVVPSSSAAPTSTDHLTRKGYVDALLTGAGAFSGESSIKYKVVSGVIRNTGSGWALLEDAGHNSSNITSISSTASGIILGHSLGATKVSSLQVTPDETLSSLGLRVGASVGLDATTLKLYLEPADRISDQIHYNGSAWVSDQGVYDLSFNSGILTLTHEAMGTAKGSGVALANRGTVLGQSGAFTDTTIQLGFYTGSFGSFTVATSPLTTMRAYVTRYGRRVSVPAVDPSTVVSANGNLWVTGILEVP